MLEVIAHNAAAVGGFLLLLWLVSLAISDVSIVDIFWGIGFVVIAWTTFLLTDAAGDRALWLPVLVTAWGLRLSGFLAWRNLGKEEDYRYREMRERYGDRFKFLSLFIVFGFQGLVMLVVSLPVQLGVATGGELGPLAVGGGVLFAIGLFFEAVGDFQLAVFKANPDNKGKVMDRGLWRYTRHPNYFGDFCVWWGLFLVALPSLEDSWVAIGPMVMSLMLLKVSGVAMLEKTIGKRRPKYADYIARTSAFFPWPPSKSDA